MFFDIGYYGRVLEAVSLYIGQTKCAHYIAILSLVCMFSK